MFDKKDLKDLFGVFLQFRREARASRTEDRAERRLEIAEEQLEIRKTTAVKKHFGRTHKS